MHLAVADDGHLDRHDQALLDRAGEQVGVGRLLFRKHLVDDRAVVAWRQAGGVRRDRGKHLAALAVRHQHDAVLGILIEETLARCGESRRNRRRAARWSAPAPAARRSCAAFRHRAPGGCCARFHRRAASRRCGPARSCCKRCRPRKGSAAAWFPRPEGRDALAVKVLAMHVPDRRNCREHRRSG